MDHDVVVREKMTEKYLLNELDSKVRDQFEEHFFDCPDCAQDIRAGSELVAHTKTVLAESPEPALVPGPRPVGRGWFAWLRPALVVPVLALLLVVIGYQNLVMVPKLQSALHQARVLPWASVNVATYGAAEPTITVHQEQGFVLLVRIPPDGVYTHYAADLVNPSGKPESSLTIPVASGQETAGQAGSDQVTSDQDQWSVQIPGANREAGSYTLSVRGVTAAGESKKIGQASFELQIQK